MTPFERFIAIDWSGAKGRRHKAIEVAVCEAGNAAPVRIAPPAKYWSREAVLDFVKAQAGARTLIGFDFSFAPPFQDRGRYLPDLHARTGPEFWAYVEEQAQDEDLGAAALIENALRPHFWFGSGCGPKAPFLRLRVAEALLRERKLGAPSSLFDCVGAGQVGKGSLAGMRLLHHARASGLAVWPFDPLPADGPVLVEIYPRAFLRLAGGRGTKLRDGAELDAALAALGSAPAGLRGPLTDHLTDALISSAGLRHVATDPNLWQPSLWYPMALTPDLARTEGWIFGLA